MMEDIKTYFASPERSSAESLNDNIERINKNPIMNELLKSVGGLLAILDSNRQILSINDSFCTLLGISDISSILGLRIGEALECQYSPDAPSGCGTGKACSSCGAAIAIVSCLATHKTVERKCYLSCKNDKDLVFLVRAHPIDMDSHFYLALFLQDMTKEDQRTCLERTFFHDINNLIQGLLSASELISSDKEGDELSEIIHKTAKLLSNEITIQRYLLDHGFHDFTMKKQDQRVISLLNELESVLDSSPLSNRRTLTFSCSHPEERVNTDRSLFLRIASNMVINALEASEECDPVHVWFEIKDGILVFSVHNSSHISDDVALRIFQRNFSTKAEAGRGLGTYSMKLLGEQILGGKVSFVSSPEEGTVFSFSF